MGVGELQWKLKSWDWNRFRKWREHMCVLLLVQFSLLYWLLSTCHIFWILEFYVNVGAWRWSLMITGMQVNLRTPGEVWHSVLSHPAHGVLEDHSTRLSMTSVFWNERKKKKQNKKKTKWYAQERTTQLSHQIKLTLIQRESVCTYWTCRAVWQAGSVFHCTEHRLTEGNRWIPAWCLETLWLSSLMKGNIWLDR